MTTLIAGLLVLEAWTPRDPGVAAIRTKLEQVLPPSLRRRAAATALTTQVIQVPTQPVDWELVGVLADAVAVGQHVRFGYTDQHDRSSSRWVEPHRHILREGHWYLIGYDVGRQDWRVFCLDRIRDVATVPGSGEPYRFPHPSIEQWLASDFGRRDARGSATVTE